MTRIILVCYKILRQLCHQRVVAQLGDARCPSEAVAPSRTARSGLKWHANALTAGVCVYGSTLAPNFDQYVTVKRDIGPFAHLQGFDGLGLPFLDASYHIHAHFSIQKARTGAAGAVAPHCDGHGSGTGTNATACRVQLLGAPPTLQTSTIHANIMRKRYNACKLMRFRILAGN